METPQIPPIDFDGAWKEALTLMLEEALRLFAPELADDIDWTAGYETLDTELQKAAPDSPFGTLAADKLFAVKLRDGNDLWLLVHIEVQSQTDPAFAERMYLYNSLLYGRYRREIWSLAVLGDESPAWKPTRYLRERQGLEASLRYPVVKLLEYDLAVLDANPNPIVAVVLAHRTAQLTRRDMALRAARRLELTRRLFVLGYDQAQIDRIERLLEWLLWLPPDLAAQTREDTIEIRKEYKMPFMTYGEQKAEAKGLAEGVAEGLRAGITVGLNIRFKEAAAPLKAQIATISDPALLEAILNKLETASTVDEVRALLPQAEA